MSASAKPKADDKRACPRGLGHEQECPRLLPLLWHTMPSPVLVKVNVSEPALTWCRSLKVPWRLPLVKATQCSHHVANISKQKATSRTYPRSLKNACSERSLQRSMALLYARHPSASTERCILSRKRSESSFVLAASARCLLTIPSLSRGQHSKEFYSHPHSNVNPHPATTSQQEKKEDILSSRG